MLDHPAWTRLLQDTPLPAALVDVDAFDANLDLLLGAMPPEITLRVASKSVRVPHLLRRVLDHDPRCVGLMTYSAPETRGLAAMGFDDLLVAYPVARPDDAELLAEAAREATVRVAIDDPYQARLLSEAAERLDVNLGLCVDIDVSWRPGGGLAHLGVRRSPIRSAADATRLARIVRDLPNVRIDSVLAYEAQVAGLGDTARDEGRVAPVMERVRGLIKQRSRPLAARRRKEVVAALRAEGCTIEVVNGGGTGSIRGTAHDGSCTEVTAGSGLHTPHLFDLYRDLNLQPALFIAIPVVRRSDPDHITCAGGGIVASGSAGWDKHPIVACPPNLARVDMEGFGEVQTPFRVTHGDPPPLGSPVILRPAKAGEPLERFDRVYQLEGGELAEDVPTFRGAGIARY